MAFGRGPFDVGFRPHRQDLNAKDFDTGGQQPRIGAERISEDSPQLADTALEGFGERGGGDLLLIHRNLAEHGVRRPEPEGLPHRFPVTVDVVARTVRGGALNVLLITRLIDPFRGKLALPGGFVLAGGS